VFNGDNSGPVSDIVLGYLSGELKAELRQAHTTPRNAVAGACYGPPRFGMPAVPTANVADAPSALPIVPPTVCLPGGCVTSPRPAPAACSPGGATCPVVVPSPSVPAPIVDSVHKPNSY
jgi:hypothetical protein